MLSRAQRERCCALLQRLAGRLPQLGMEGDCNVWILKPGAKSRGRGKAGGSGGHRVPAKEGLPLSPVSPRHRLCGAAGGGAAAGGGLRSTLIPGWWVGGAEVRGAAAAHLWHQIRCPAMVPGDQLEPTNHLVLPRELPAVLLPALLPAPPGPVSAPCTGSRYPGTHWHPTDPAPLSLPQCPASLQRLHPEAVQAGAGPAPPAAPRPDLVLPAAPGVPGTGGAGGCLAPGDGARHEDGSGGCPAQRPGPGGVPQGQLRALWG